MRSLRNKRVGTLRSLSQPYGNNRAGFAALRQPLRQVPGEVLVSVNLAVLFVILSLSCEGSASSNLLLEDSSLRLESHKNLQDWWERKKSLSHPYDKIRAGFATLRQTLQQNWARRCRLPLPLDKIQQ